MNIHLVWRGIRGGPLMDDKGLRVPHCRAARQAGILNLVLSAEIAQ
jgi:hypothetical protein